MLYAIPYFSQKLLTISCASAILFLSASNSDSMAFCLSADSSLIFLNVSSCCFFFIEPILPDKPLINIPAIISVIPTAITLNERIPPITAKITPATIPVTLLFLYSFAFSSFAFSFSLTISNLISLPAREFCLFLAAIHLS